MTIPLQRRVRELPREWMHDRWWRVMQIETATEDAAAEALTEAEAKGWQDRMGGICRTGDPVMPFGLVLEKEDEEGGEE